MKTRRCLSHAFLVILFTAAAWVRPTTALASPNVSHSCPNDGWSPWQQVRLTTQWIGNPDPSYTSYYEIEFRPERTGAHQIEFSGPWTGSVDLYAYWRDQSSGQSGSIGAYRLGDKKLELWSGSAGIYYTFSIGYSPAIVGSSATMEYRVKCAPASSSPGRQGYSSVPRIYDFRWGWTSRSR